MPYTEANDPYARVSDTEIAQGARLTALSASGSDLTSYPKALWIYVAPGTAGPHITCLPIKNADGSTIQLTFNDGAQVFDAVRVRQVSVIASGVTVLAIND